MLWFAEATLAWRGVLGCEAQDLTPIATFKTQDECKAALEAHRDPVTGRFLKVWRCHPDTVDPRGPKGG